MVIKICIIEDEQQLVDEIKTWLTFEGYDVCHANDGQKGIQTILEQRPDLVVCDINMPVMDGYEVLTEVRSIPEIKSTPFLFLTAQSSPHDFRKGLGLGADDYITKPFEYDELLRAINQRLKHKHDITLSAFKDFSRMMITYVDDINTEFASYLDNGVVSPLNALRIYANMMAKRTGEPEHLREIIVRLDELTKNIEQIHAILTPDSLIYLGAVPMINWLIFYYQNEQPELQITFDHTQLASHHPETILRQLFAIMNESLSNIVKYAQASTVNIYLQQIGNHLYGSITDDGIGFDIDNYWQQVNTLGLVTMRERAAFCGGGLELLSDIDVGTTINFDLNLDVNFKLKQHQAGNKLPEFDDRYNENDANNASLISVVIAYPDRLIQLGLKHLIASEKDMTVLAMSNSIKSLMNLFEDKLKIDVAVISAALLEEMTPEQRAIASVSSRHLVALGNDKHHLSEGNLKYVNGYLMEIQSVDQLVPCIRSVDAGKQHILSDNIDHPMSQTSGLEVLTPREMEILEYIANNHRNSEIAEELFISIRTVETHRANIMRKLEIKDKSELIVFAIRHGIISLDQ